MGVLCWSMDYNNNEFILDHCMATWADGVGDDAVVDCEWGVCWRNGHCSSSSASSSSSTQTVDGVHSTGGHWLD